MLCLNERLRSRELTLLEAGMWVLDLSFFPGHSWIQRGKRKCGVSLARFENQEKLICVCLFLDFKETSVMFLQVLGLGGC